MNLTTKVFKKLKYRLLKMLQLDHERFDGLKLPLQQFRYCGIKTKDNAYYIESAQIEVEKLIEYCHLNDGSHLLDVGCGQGRIPLGLISLSKSVLYKGIDIDRRSLNWCKRYIETKHSGFEFSLLDVHNNRYNPNGKPLDQNFRFNFDENTFDIIYLYSVFSHMIPPEINYYLKEFKRLLKPSGHVMFTTFVEEDVPDFEENPPNYKHKWEGPLHCVRYDRNYLTRLINDEGFHLKHFEYATADDGQSVLVLTLR